MSIQSAQIGYTEVRSCTNTAIPSVKLVFRNADTDTDTDILARMSARMSVSVSVSASWNASFTDG